MNKRAIRAIVRKDLKVAVQNRGVVIPLIVVPLVLFVALPWLALFVPNLAKGANSGSFTRLTDLLARMPAGLQASFAGYSDAQRVVVFLLEYVMAPMFLIVPVMVASVIAADSFAGEKERKTLEALLYTPTSDREVFVAKLLSAWLPSMAVALIGFLLYAVTVNVVGWPTMGRIFFPNLMWVALILWVAPATAGLGLGTMVLVSILAQGFQDAYQMGGVIVLPILLLVFGQVAGVMYFSVGVVLLLGLLLWVADGLLLRVGSRSFRRGQLAARL
jgi:ABC-2 type transport system permease protein